MHKTKNILLIIFVVAIVGCMLYVPGIRDLGLYRDDWNNYYTAVVRGPEMLSEHFAADRPAMGWLISMLYRVFGTNNLGYLIWNLCCRILGSIFLALTLLNVWPKTSKMAAIAGILAVAFPGFLQQIDGIDYTAHQTAMFCFMFSLWLTSLACKPGEKSWNVLFTFLSMLLSAASMLLMEYYVGMEIYRFCIIYMMNREQAENGKPKSFFKALLSYLPYLLPVAGFVYWRTFMFSAERPGTNMLDDVIAPILAHPLNGVGELGVHTVKNIWKLFIGVWTVPAYNLINGLGMKPFIYSLIPSLIIFGVAQVFLFLMHRKRTEESVHDAHHEAAQWLWCGLISGAIAILPLTIAHRDITFNSTSLERFAWPGMLGSIMFLTGLMGSLKDRSLRNLMTMAVILVAVFVQWQNKQNYIDSWAETKDYWQQLIWRAPGLEKGTTIATQGGLLIEEDYDIFAAASMIYYPEEKEWSPISAEVLNSNTIQDIKMGKSSGKVVRNIYVERDYGDKLLAISKPSRTSCLRVIDGEAPIYSANDWTSIPEIGSYSKIGMIITDPDHDVTYPFFLGEEQEHGWCYYYEKMELALQMDDAEKAASLADEAFGKNLKAEDGVEWIPVIEAYAETGRAQDARSIASRLLANEYMSFTAAEYFAAKENAADYYEVIDVLRPELLEGLTAAEDLPVEESSEEAEGSDEAEEPAVDDPAEETTVAEEPAADDQTADTAADTTVLTAADDQATNSVLDDPAAETVMTETAETAESPAAAASEAASETEEEFLLSNDMENGDVL